MTTRTGLLFVLVVGLALGSVASRSVLAQPRTTQGTAALDPGGTVVVENHEGRIAVETWDRAEVQYEAVVRSEEDAEHPEATKVRVDERADRFEIRTVYDESREGDDESGWFGGNSQNIMPVTYTLTIPRTAPIEIEDHESEIRVEGGEGRTTIDTHDGTVTLTNRHGRAEIGTHDGPITVERHTGPLLIDTHDGRIRLATIDGRTEIETHDGQIEANELRGGLRVETHDGRGQFSFDALTDDVVIDTHGGTFTLTLPAEAGFDLQTDFDDDVDLRSDVDLSPYRIVGDDEDEVNYEGSIRGGGPRLSFTAHDGSFELRTQ